MVDVIKQLQQDGLKLKDFYDQTQEMCHEAITQNPMAIQYVIDQTESLNKLAVQKMGMSLMHIRNPTEELCNIVIRKDGILTCKYALKFGKHIKTEDELYKKIDGLSKRLGN